jgi:hypothetical protein
MCYVATAKSRPKEGKSGTRFAGFRVGRFVRGLKESEPMTCMTRWARQAGRLVLLAVLLMPAGRAAGLDFDITYDASVAGDSPLRTYLPQALTQWERVFSDEVTVKLYIKEGGLGGSYSATTLSNYRSINYSAVTGDIAADAAAYCEETQVAASMKEHKPTSPKERNQESSGIGKATTAGIRHCGVCPPPFLGPSEKRPWTPRTSTSGSVWRVCNREAETASKGRNVRGERTIRSCATHVARAGIFFTILSQRLQVMFREGEGVLDLVPVALG